MNKQHYFLYVLRLEDSKFYIGITTRTPEIRFQEHKSGFMGAQWTKTHKPISIYYQKDLGYRTKQSAEIYENRVTRKYIKRYGIDNVRGGDISYNEPVVIHLGRFFLKSDWGVITTASFLVIIILALSVAYVIK